MKMDGFDKTMNPDMSVNILLAGTIYSEKTKEGEDDNDNLIVVSGLPTKEYFLKTQTEAYDGTLLKQIQTKIKYLFKKALEDELKSEAFQSKLFDLHLPKRKASPDRHPVISIRKTLKTEIDISSMCKTLKKYYPCGDNPDFMTILRSFECPTFILADIGIHINPIVLRAGDWKIRPIISSDYCFIRDIQMELEVATS